MLVGAQGVAAVFDEVQHVIEIGAGQGCVWGGLDDFVVDLIRKKRGAAGKTEQVLGQDVEATGAGGIAVEFPCGDAEDGGLTFQDLETVGGNQDGFGGFVHAVVGTADALQQAGDAFGGADLDDLIDASPVDA